MMWFLVEIHYPISSIIQSIILCNTQKFVRPYANTLVRASRRNYFFFGGSDPPFFLLKMNTSFLTQKYFLAKSYVIWAIMYNLLILRLFTIYDIAHKDLFFSNKKYYFKRIITTYSPPPQKKNVFLFFATQILYYRSKLTFLKILGTFTQKERLWDYDCFIALKSLDWV